MYLPLFPSSRWESYNHMLSSAIWASVGLGVLSLFGVFGVAKSPPIAVLVFCAVAWCCAVVRHLIRNHWAHTAHSLVDLWGRPSEGRDAQNVHAVWMSTRRSHAYVLRSSGGVLAGLCGLSFLCPQLVPQAVGVAACVLSVGMLLSTRRTKEQKMLSQIEETIMVRRCTEKICRWADEHL